MKRFNHQKGIILIEAILALGIIVVIMTALVTALVSSTNSSNFSKDQTLATGFSQEGLEVARNFKDSDYSTFSNLSVNSYCLGEGETEINPANTSNCTKNIAGKFTRTIYINRNGRDPRDDESTNECEATSSIFVASTVSWTDSKCRSGTDCHKVELNSCFVNLYKINPI